MANKVTVPTSLHSHASSVPILNGSNVSEWYEQVQFTLGVLDLDMTLLVDKPVDITEDSTTDEVNLFKSWERSNRLSLMFMRMTIANNIKTSLPQNANALEFLRAVEDRFRSADKSLAGTLMAELTTTKYDGNRGVQDHILNMTDKAAKLNALGMRVDESFLVQFILNSLPSQFGPFKIHYNTNKDKWSLNELTNMCVQEEMRLRQEGRHSVLAVTQGVIKKKGKSEKWKKNPLKKRNGPEEGNQDHANNSFTVTCYFCGKKGHVKKDCSKRKAWFEKRGIPYNPETKGK
uniref:CCHC-type domain-containing protein n=1 Tax=Davidia involucrata TaxID=16924 RepID=A0A5B7BVZ8_DAVIN